MIPAKQQLEVYYLNFKQGQWVLIGYHSKELPQAAQNHNRGRVDRCSFWHTQFSQLLMHQYFKVLVDHEAYGNLKKGKNQQ